MELIILAVVAGLSFASYALWRQARAGGDAGPKELDQRPAAGELTDGERTIHTVRTGDIVTHLATDYLVEGVLSLDDDGRLTRLYRIADGAHVRWLGARPGDDHPLLLDEAADLTIEPNGPAQITHHGIPYRLAARESALAAGSGALGGDRGNGRVQVWEYVGGGAARILAVAWPARVEAFTGERVAPHFVELLPGDPHRND